MSYLPMQGAWTQQERIKPTVKETQSQTTLKDKQPQDVFKYLDPAIAEVLFSLWTSNSMTQQNFLFLFHLVCVRFPSFTVEKGLLSIGNIPSEQMWARHCKYRDSRVAAKEVKDQPDNSKG